MNFVGIYGTMGSSKTAHLLITAYNYIDNNLNPLILTSNLDNRYAIGVVRSRIEGLKSRDAITISNNHNIFDVVKAHIEEKGYSPDIILVDEAQFLTKDHVWQLTEIVDRIKIPVHAYFLRTDFKGEPFEGSKYILAWCDEIQEIESISRSNHKTIMNARVVDNKIVKTGKQIKIGGNESYQAVDRVSWKDNKLID